MKLENIAKAVSPLAVTGPLNREIAGIAYDSRKVRQGYLFFALHGTQQDGRDFIDDAAAKGAVAIVSEQEEVACRGLTHLRVADGRKAMAEIASMFFGEPSRALQVAGVTGTNGKTTVSFMVRDILAAAGRAPGLMGTVCYEMGTRAIPASRTTPEAVDLHAMLAEMLHAGCRSAVIEVSSHSLAQRRVWGVEFDAAIFTNLSHDHLDYHRTMEEYFEAKCLLFRWLGQGRKKDAVALINIDDPWGRRLAESKCFTGRTITFGCGPDAAVRAEDIRRSERGSEFHLRSPWGDAAMEVNLLGRHNVLNALAALATGGALGADLAVMARAVARCTLVPGRLEEIPTGKGVRVFVDYAHTDDALRNALRTLREVAAGRLLAVFGCGGNRDTLKRPVMGAAAAELADYSVLTSDNPRKDPPMEIIEDIRKGFGDRTNYEVVADRAEAIYRALQIAREGDIVLIAGKGHESFQELANTTIPFDDRQVVRSMV